MPKWRVKLYDVNNKPWDLVGVCHQFPDVHRWIAHDNIRATHFTSLDEARKALEAFKKSNNQDRYNAKIIEI